VAVSRANALLSSGHSPAYALTHGYALGFLVIAGVAAAGLIVTLITIGPVARAGAIAPDTEVTFAPPLSAEPSE
jgi:hypothetical protein